MISVVIPAYNASGTIEAALDSARAQQRVALEIVVVDDGSDDGTRDVVRAYGSGVRLLEATHKGAVPAANAGFRAATGTYVVKLDADDRLEDAGALGALAAALDNDPGAAYAYGDYIEERDGAPVRVSTASNLFATIAGGVLFRRQALDEVGGYAEDLRFPEYDLLLRTRGHWRGIHVPVLTYRYIRRGASLTGSRAFVEQGLAELRARHPDHLSAIEHIREY
ncbi:MAG: glycosyltransferase family 2 protein [Vicinamibacterales bacterium]